MSLSELKKYIINSVVTIEADCREDGTKVAEEIQCLEGCKEVLELFPVFGVSRHDNLLRLSSP